MKKIKKNYHVSMAIKLYANFETRVVAGNQKEAYEKAVELYESGDFGESGDYGKNGTITEPDWANMELDIIDDFNDSNSGVDIYELKRKPLDIKY